MNPVAAGRGGPLNGVAGSVWRKTSGAVPTSARRRTVPP